MQWIEKDCSEWARENLKEYLCGVELDDAVLHGEPRERLRQGLRLEERELQPAVP